MRFLVFIGLIFFALTYASGQSGSGAIPSDSLPPDSLMIDFYRLHSVERGGETLPEINIKEVVIIGKPSAGKKFPYHKYQRMVNNLKKVYPYALVVRSKLETINEELAGIPEDRDRKKYIRQAEKNLFGEYEKDVRDMTITQGRLLIKLIDRETRNTSYELIRFYRGSISAAFWQGIARIFGTNLKEEYDPYGDDAIMEIIVQAIESGNL